MLKLEDLDVYRLAMEIGEGVWNQVSKWTLYNKTTIGTQLVRSTDSIAANIAEGYGRFHYKENKLFCFYARGFLMETKTWLSKASRRNLIPNTEFKELISKLETLHFKLNAYIKSIGKVTLASNDK